MVYKVVQEVEVVLRMVHDRIVSSPTQSLLMAQCLQQPCCSEGFPVFLQAQNMTLSKLEFIFKYLRAFMRWEANDMASSAS